MASIKGKEAFSRVLYPPGDPVRIHKYSPPTSDESDTATMPNSSSGPQYIRYFSHSKHIKPPDKGKRMYSLVDPPDPPQSFNFIQSNRKIRPFSNPSSWAVPKTWRSSERKSFNHFLLLRTTSRTERAQARMRGPEINNNSTKNKG